MAILYKERTKEQGAMSPREGKERGLGGLSEYNLIA